MVQVSDEPRITGDIGGQPKQRYWTPDGREIWSMPDIHENALGFRDANLDRGWLTTKPTELKLYCPHCDRWHDTIKEVNQCGAKRKVLYAKHARLARKELKVTEPDERINKLESDMAEIKGLLKRLLEVK